VTEGGQCGVPTDSHRAHSTGDGWRSPPDMVGWSRNRLRLHGPTGDPVPRDQNTGTCFIQGHKYGGTITQ
jgi:hypothetical protein